MEAIREFEVVDMPVTVAVDTKGMSIHEAGCKKMEDHRYSLDSKGNQSFFDTIGLKCLPLG